MADHLKMQNYSFANRDEFGRQPIAEKIIKLLDSDIEVSPLIIDGKWGTGKTEFCFKLKNLIEADETTNYKVGYINAFQADHTNEPLLSLIAEVASFYSENDEKRASFIRNAIPYLRLVSGIGIKALAGLAFGKYGADIPDEFSEGVDAIKDGSESFIDRSLESMIKDQVEAEKNLSTLRTALTEIASTTPIILLIDELDRCRPDFAIMMLETIKHVFDVGNVQIILVTNAEQLKATIKHSYGSETDSHNYLYKFFKYQINLPTSLKDNEGNTIENNATYFQTLIQESKIIPRVFKDNTFVYDIPNFLDVSALSLRNTEQVVRCIETLIIFKIKDLNKIESIVITLLSFLYIMDKKLLKEIAKNNIDRSDLNRFINLRQLELPRNNEEFTTKDILSLIFNRYSNLNLLKIPPNDIHSRLRHVEARKNFDSLINQYEMADIDYVEDLLNKRYHRIYIYEYIAQTINNLLLFDIV